LNTRRLEITTLGSPFLVIRLPSIQIKASAIARVLLRIDTAQSAVIRSQAFEAGPILPLSSFGPCLLCLRIAG
jgi:hypothetical protein